MGTFLDEFLVNEKPQQSPSATGGSGSFLQNFLDEELRQASIEPPKPPANWFGEATAGVARGVDELQQMGYGAGALGASWLGAEGVKDWFIKGYLGNEKEIQANPASTPSYKDINGIDSAVRYALASVGELSPMIAESVITGGIGSLAGVAESAVGTVAKRAVGKLVSGEVRQGITPAIKSELSSYLEGAIAKEALSPLALEFATKEASALASKYGANAAIAVSSIAKEAGGIYGDLLADPNIAESDRRVAATVGGIIAAIPDTAVQGWLVGKFFPGVAKEQVTKAMAADASWYLARFASTAAKEVAKVTAAEGGQETIQTIVELASKNWADPAHRYDFLSFTPEQWTEVIDAGLKGAIGGGAFGGTIATVAQMRTQHPNPEVRSDMRSVLSKADDVPVIHPESTPEHDELHNLENQIAAKQAAINQATTPEAAAAIQLDLDPLQTRAEELSAKLYPKPPEEETTTGPSLVNHKTDEVVEEKKAEPTPENKPSPLPTPSEELITTTGAFYAQEMPNLGQYTPTTTERINEVRNKRTENETHINSIAGANPTYGARLKQELNQPGVSEMMAHEGISLATETNPKSKKAGWAAVVEGNKIKLYVPHGSDINAQANTRDAVIHELGHLHDLVSLREQWKQGDRSTTLAKFVDQQSEARGQEYLDHAEAFPSIFQDKIAETFKTAYDPKSQTTDKKELSALTLGQEIPRMMWEWARTGKLGEATDALAQAAEKNSGLDLFMRGWLDAIKKAGEWLKRFITGDSTPQLRAAYDAMNAVADKYGILVNQNRPIRENKTPTPVLRPSVAVNPVRNPVTESLAKPTKPATAYSNFVSTAKAGNPSDTVRSWLDWRRTKNDVPTTKPELNESLADLNSRLKNPISQKAFNAIVKERNQANDQATKTTSEPAQKASLTEESTERFGGAIQPDSRGTQGYNHAIIASVAEKAGPGIEGLKTYLQEHHPLLIPHFESIVEQVRSHEPTIPAAYPVRGENTADTINQYQYVMFVAEKVHTLSSQLGQERGITIIGANQEFPDNHYVIDTSATLDGEAVDPASSVHLPVQLTDKLKEAQLTRGIPETHGLVDIGAHTIDENSVAVFDNHFGENNWIIKSFSENALKSYGVFFADAVKAYLAAEPNTFVRVRTDEGMVQALHDIIPSDRASNEKILKGREIRVHILTDMNGEPHVLPLSTLWKLPKEEADVADVATMTPIVVEDESIQLAHQRALDAIRSLPESDRTGQFYGLDLVKLRNDQDWGIVENNPTDSHGQSGFFVLNPLVQDSYMAALLGEQPIHAELARLVHETQSAPLVNQNEESSPARKPSYIYVGADRDFEVTPEVYQYFVERKELLAEIEEERAIGRGTMQQYLDAKKAWHNVEGRIREFGEEFGAVQEVGPAGALPRLAGDIGLISGVSSEEAENELRGYRQLKMSFDTAWEIDSEQRKLMNSLDRRLSEMDRNAMVRFDLSSDNLGYVLESRQYENALVNEDSSTPALKPTFTPVVERQLDQLQQQANTALNQDLEATLKQGRPETKLRGNRPDIVGYTPTDLEYQVQHQGEPINKAKEVLNKHGLWKVLDAFMEQSHAAIVKRFNIEEQDGPAGEPDTVMAALRQQVLAQLHHIIETLGKENDSRTRNARTWLGEQFEAMEKLNAQKGTAAGQVSSLSGRVFKIMNGARAMRDYFEEGSKHLMKVLGKKAESFVNGDFAKEVNALRVKYMGSAMNSREMLALLGELNKRIHTKQYQKDARATLAKNDQRVRNVSKSSAAKAAEHVSMDELGEQWAKEVSDRMVKMMNGLPRGADKLTELELFNRTVSQIVRENAGQAGLIGESIKNSPTIAQQFAVVINNDALYREFTNTLVNKMLQEYKPEPGSEFAKQVLEFRDQMANHLWRDGLVTSLVNEKLKQYQLTLSEIIKKHIRESGGRNYIETHELVERMRNDVRAMMEAEGVSNEGLLNQMLEDVEANLREQIEQKRLDFLGSTAGGREFLKHMQTTLGNKAKEHALSNVSMFGELHTWLSDDLGIPDDMAQALASVMDRQLGNDIKAEREAIVQRRIEALKETLPPKQKKQVDMAMKKLLTAVNLGVMKDEEAYNAFAGPLGLPPWNPEVAAQADKLGETIATAPNALLRQGFEKELSDLMESQKAISPYDMFISAMYANILSGPSTHLVNIVSNAGSLMGYVATNIAQNPRRAPSILNALWRAAIGEAQTEMREAFWTGHSFTKNSKFFRGPNPLEITSPHFESQRSHGKLKAIEEKAASLTHQLYSAVGAKYIGRSLLAADVFFYKMAQEASFAAKVGDYSLVNQTMWESARVAAREDLRKIGINPDESTATRRRAESLAYKILNDMRLQDSRTGLVDDNLREAWMSSHQEALDATFQQEPKGLLGKLAKVIETWTETKGDEVNPIGKLLIPFTRVAANVTNQMLEWTPYGLIRFGVGHTFGEDFRLKEENGTVIGRDRNIATRAILGTGAMMILYAILANQDNDDPWLALYADGPKNSEAKRQLLDRGWKPNSLKVGNSYISYIPTPFAIAFSIVGRMWDDHREGKPLDPLNVSAASVAILRAVTNQSFLASVTDFMAAVDSPEPEKRLSRVMARIATVPIPNLAQQVDKWVNPSIQQASGFWESVVKNMPVVRGFALQPMLNVFGEPVNRTPGLGFIPGMERFITMERSDDPIYNVLGEKRITVPGFSKSAKLGDNAMTAEQFYTYVQTAGPLVKQALEADLPRIRSMDREQAQEHVEKVTSEVKKRVRQQMKSSLVN